MAAENRTTIQRSAARRTSVSGSRPAESTSRAMTVRTNIKSMLIAYRLRSSSLKSFSKTANALRIQPLLIPFIETPCDGEALKLRQSTKRGVVPQADSYTEDTWRCRVWRRCKKRSGRRSLCSRGWGRQHRRRDRGLRMEVADERYLWLEPVTRPVLDRRLNERYQGAHSRSRWAAPVDDDGRVPVRDTRPADAGTLEPGLIDQTPGSDALDLLKDRSGTGLRIERRMPLGAPLQIRLHDLPHPRLVALSHLEGDGEHDVVAFVQDGVIVAEIEIVTLDICALAFSRKDFGTEHDLLDKHRPLALRGRREEVKVLPQAPAAGGRDADIMLEP